MKWRTVNPWCIESDAGYRLTRAGRASKEVFACWRVAVSSNKHRTKWEAFHYTECRDEAMRLIHQDHEEKQHGNAR